MRRVLQPEGLFVLAGGHTFTVDAHVHWDEGRSQFGSCGDLTRVQAQRAADALLNERVPVAPQVPWALGVVKADGGAVISASPMLHSGLFWQSTNDRFVAATDPGQIVAASPGPMEVDADFLLQTLARRPPADGSILSGVHRLEPGHTLRWQPGTARVRVHQWSGPEVWEAPFRQGPDTRRDYVTMFDRVVDDGVCDGEPVVMLLSGGLDSTFVAASLVRHATRDRPVVGLVHRPAKHARIRPQRGVQIDEWDSARELAATYPGRIQLVEIAEEVPRCTLDVALEDAQRGWTVTVNPANSRWTSRGRELALEMGATRLHTGSSGNYTFSNPHPYALAHLLRRGRFQAVQRLLAHRAETQGWPSAVRGAAVQVTGPVRQRDDGTRAYVQHFDMNLDVVGWTRPQSSYADFRDSLADLGVSSMGSANPARFRGLLDIDPFEAPDMLRFAAQITPLEWVSAPGPRGFARAAAAGRVPDSIRLRRTRGGQSMDAWWAARHHRDRYVHAAQSVADTPNIRDWIDSDALVRRVRQWPWHSAAGPALLELAAVERLLHTSEFVRWLTPRLRNAQTA